MTEDLLPCPFCDGPADIFDGYEGTAVICVDCGAEGPLEHDTAEAADAWNERPREIEQYRLGQKAADLETVVENVILAELDYQLRRVAE